jgi:DNA-binding LytR/AlgR family response regulator
MKAVIIEDEYLAAEGLELMLKRYDATITVVARLDSVKTSVEWFNKNPAPDIAFFDIQLADGLSFEIFEQAKVACPVIFTTAFNQYAIDAFKVNSIDYLLKPFGVDDIKKAFEKLKILRNEIPTESALRRGDSPTPSTPDLATMQRLMLSLTQKQYKSRFMVKVGDHLSAINVEEVAYFYSENKITWLKHLNGRKYPIDYKLEELDTLLTPNRFFRLNRTFISAIDAIKDVISYSNSRLKVVLKDPPDKEDILISREKVQEFKGWLDQ